MDMNEDLVDILMTTYNSNIDYLIKQIDSLISQTHKNIKIYISDDNSDNPKLKDILKKYENNDNRIKVFFQDKNIGVNQNFEFLLTQSSASYIMFCDHDDIWAFNKVEKSLDTIKKENVDMVYCDAKQVDEDGNRIGNSYLRIKKMPIIEGKLNCKFIARHTIIGCSQIITKEVKEKMLPFKEIVNAHDWLSVVIANELKGIKFLDNPLLEYRLHNNNIFGGRSTNQNLTRWKNTNDNTYKSFLKYREHVIEKGYESGAAMYREYAISEITKKQADKAIKYFEKLKKTRYFNFQFHNYFRFLSNKGMFKRMIKEIALFHFPFIAFIVYKM